MRLILGTRNKVEAVGGGAFFCPACKSQTNYARVRLARYFHISSSHPDFPHQDHPGIHPMRGLPRRRTSFRSGGAEPRASRADHRALDSAPPAANKNSATEKACVSCGAARERGASSAAGTAWLACGCGHHRVRHRSGTRGPVKKSGAPSARSFSFWDASSASMSSSPWPSISCARNYRKDHPERFVKRPGEHEFKEASTTITTGLHGVTHGNTPAAEENWRPNSREALGSAA